MTHDLPLDETPRLRPDTYIPELTPVSESFRVTDTKKADWVVQRIAEVRAERNAVDAAYKATVSEWKAWQEAEHKRLASTEDWWIGVLQAYWFRYAEDHPKAKSLKLPHGRLQQRKQPKRLTIEDRDQFTAWSVENYPSLVRTKYEPDMPAIKKLVDENWHLPGVDVTDLPDKFSVVTDGGPNDGED